MSAPGIVARVNARLKGMGRSERLVRGRGYFYFAGGDAPTWRSSSIIVYRAEQLGTVDEVIAEMLRLAGDDAPVTNDRG